jgi:hypothetical protein
LSFAVSVVVPEWLNEIQSEYAENPETSAIINNPVQDTKYEWRNAVLWYKGRIYLSPNSKFKSNILKESHDSPTAGHVGFSRPTTMQTNLFFGRG